MSRRPAIDREVDETEHLWIGMPDGVRLAARLWLPREAARRPVPALLEYIPYRKGDMVRARDERYHPYFAAHGYACLRVDMRGSGDSEGRMTDMYTPEELSDARHVIDWIASRPWCSGSVGMFGKSWGGTASLQASVDAPEALKAVIAVCATHDRYEDDIHHMGGCLLTDSVEWGATLPAILASPPGAGTVGPGWRALWEDRLAHLAFPLEPWVREEARTAYWRRGSVRFEADRIACPILAIGGWADRYSSSVMSLVDRRPDRVWGIVGPWGHQYPDTGHPGPAAGFQQLALEWWDHWLKTPRPPRPPWPPLRVWLRGFDPPADAIDRRNGEWIESKGPAAASTLHAFHLDRGGLRGSPPRAASGSEPMPGPELAPVPDDLRAGLASGDTGYFGRFGGLPLDQGPDDARSLVYETAPLREAFTLFGTAELMLEVAASRPLAQLSVRIGDVAPDGRVCRVGLALRNLALDDDPERDVTGARPGPGKIRIRLPTGAYRFAAGHRIRLALASSCWPMAWPSPEAAGVRIVPGASRLVLPRLHGPPAPLRTAMPGPLDPPAKGHTVLAAPPLDRRFEVETDGTLVSSWRQPFSRVRYHTTRTTFGFETRARHAIHPDDPLSATSRFDHRMRYERPDGEAEVTSWAAVTGDAAAFSLSGQVTVRWNGETVFERNWSPRVARRLS